MSARAGNPSILLIAGSPRRGGNSDMLLDAFSAGVHEAGASVTRIIATSADVEPCRGCHACSKTGTCVIRDGMGAIYPSLDGADALAIATPVYFATVPAGLKALYDRMQPYWARRYVLGRPARPKRPAALLLAAGGGDPFGTGCAVTTTRSAMAVAGFSFDDERILEVVGPDAVGDLAADAPELVRARALGAALVAATRGTAGA